MKRGFTLVELSIVLVIIGLLIGGILVAQSMISTAKVQSFVRQIQQFDAAVANFETKYNSIPGDSKLFTTAGNGDGVIQDGLMHCCNGGYTEEFSYEETNFWPHLQQGGFVLPNATLSATITGNFSVAPPTQNSPKINLGNNNTGILPFYSAASDPSSLTWFVADFSTLTAGDPRIDENYQPSNVYWKAPIAVADAEAVDTKMDDGLPASGNVVEGTWHTTCTTAAKYTVSNSAALCSLRIKMLASQGMQQ